MECFPKTQDQFLRTPRPESGFRSGDPIAWVLIGVDGKTRAKLLEGASPGPFSHGHARVEMSVESGGRVFYDPTGKPSFTGKSLSPIKSPFIDGYAVVGSGVINTKGEWTVPPTQDRSIVTFGAIISDGVVLVHDRSGPEERIDIVSVATGSSVSSFPAPHGYRLAGCGLVSVRSSEQPLLWGCVDRFGKQVIAHQFKDPLTFENGFSTTRLPAREGEKPKVVVVNTSGKVIYTKPF